MTAKVYPWNVEVWGSMRRWLNRMPHALLIHGPEGIGKLALAEHLAQSLLCESSEASEKPCGACDGCRWVMAGTHPDLRIVEPEALAREAPGDDEDTSRSETRKPSTEIKVDQIRALAGFLSIRSHREGRRVVLVHPAEAMNPNAANALLKGLEEPPGASTFILVCHRTAQLLPTIRSRCVPVAVPMPSLEVARNWLLSEAGPEADRWLTYAGGAPLRALRHASEAEPALELALKALARRDYEAFGAASDREQVGRLAEALQKHALDNAFQAYCGRGRFGVGSGASDGASWLRFARAMGKNRALAGHPLNPKLFVAQMLGEVPKD